jgi:Ni/Fe-hydrogenase subunit HybB-like protein
MSHDTTRDDTKIFTPFNVITGIIIFVGLILTVLRFTKGIGAVTNLDDNNPWGLWIGFDLLCGVALAAGGYVTSAACYIFGLKRYHSAVRPAILTAFLGYALVVFALNYDVGRPWRLPYPIFFSPGTTSLLYEVGLCVFLYLTVLFIEYSPAALEWLGLSKIRNIIVRLTLVLTIFGVVHDRAIQAPPPVVFGVSAGVLFRFQYFCRYVHGDFRRFSGASLPAPQDG